ncbi:hypothetical protein EJ110_NYTH39453 [Nymphaea thermarum]|nr:hypothetical protein EJ110_NYTH39453 [Nymphaea thermarum]
MSPEKSRHDKQKKKRKDSSHPLPLIGVDPSSNLLPSRHEFFQVLAVAAIAVIVAFSCNLATKKFLLHRSKPLCDNGEFSGKHFQTGFYFISADLVHGLCAQELGKSGTKEVKCPDALAEKHKSVTCLVHEWVVKHVLFLVATIPMVCEVLEEAALMAKDTGTEGDSWVVASRLRDHLLSPKERTNSALWKKVEALVQEDSRLDQYQKLIKGEPKIVWEWQGMKSSLNASKKGSKVYLIDLRCEMG